MGQWCNMGYGQATGSLWIYGNCSDISIRNCQIQCSSHHGLTIHSGSTAYLSKNIYISGCRALYCGCGQLRGETASQQANAALRVPETEGYGYLDWSVAYDLCENQSVENVTLEDCYALEGWKAGFYTEPESTGGPVKNLTLKRCLSVRAGQRAVIPGSNPKATIPEATEGSNFYMQGGYFEDCISIEGEKAGWYIDSNRIGANTSGEGKTQFVRCGDIGSPISLVTEMYDCSEINSDGFFSINAKNWAMWLFGGNPLDNWPGNGFILKNTMIAAIEGQDHPVVKIGYMLRQQLRESRDPYNQSLVAPGGKYDVLRAHLTESLITGDVLNLPDETAPVEIVEGATFNGFGPADVSTPGNGIELKCSTTEPDINGLVHRYLSNVPSESTIPLEGWVINKKDEPFTFNDLASATVQALKTAIKNSGRILIAKLVEEGAISEDAAYESTLYTPPTYGYIKSTRTYYSKPPFVSFKAGGLNSGTVSIQMDATPAQNNIDGVIAYADSSMNVAGFGNLAILVRFNPDGYFDARNGYPGNNTMQCLNKVFYAAGTKYYIEIIAKTAEKTYSVYITPEGGQRIEIARDYGFRTTAAAATDDIGQVFFISEEGENLFKVQNHVIQVSNAAYYSTPPFNPFNLGCPVSGRMNIQYDVTPAQSNIDGVMSFADSNMNVISFNNLAMLVRFNTDGYFDARNGYPGNNTQQCLAKVYYTANIRYHIEIMADTNTKLYSVYVTPDGGQRTEIAKNYGFRTTAAAATDDIGQMFLISEYGTSLYKVENFVMLPQ